MWAGQFWGPLQGALSQFIDIQTFDLQTTGMSLRLRQPCLSVLYPAKKPRGPAALGLPLPLHGCHGEQISSAALCHTHVVFSFSYFLSCCFTDGAARELSVHQLFLVCHRYPHTYTVQRGTATENPTPSFPQMHAWQQLYSPCLLWNPSESFISKDVSGQVVKPCWRSK